MNAVRAMFEAGFLQVPWVERIGWTLLHSLWQIAVIALLYAMVSALLRKQAAKARYLLGCAAMLAMVCFPVGTYLLLPGGGGAGETLAAVDSPPVVAGLAEEPATGFPPPDVAPPLLGASGAPPSGVPAPDVVSEPVPAAEAAPSAIDFSATLRPWMPWATTAWLLGVCLLSLRPIGGWLHIRRLQRHGLSPLTDPLRQAAGRLARRLGVTQTVQFVQSTLVEVPTVVGCLRPFVLLPASAVSGLSVAEIELILTHELAHIRRHDYLANLAQTLIESLLFFHPAMWWVSRQVRRERENCCDDIVVAVSGNRAHYVQALTRLEEQRLATPAAVLAATGGSLLDRVRRLLGQPSAGFGYRSTTAWLAGLLTIGIVSLALAIGDAPQGDPGGNEVAAKQSDDATPESDREAMLAYARALAAGDLGTLEKIWQFKDDIDRQFARNLAGMFAGAEDMSVELVSMELLNEKTLFACFLLRDGPEGFGPAPTPQFVFFHRQEGRWRCPPLANLRQIVNAREMAPDRLGRRAITQKMIALRFGPPQVMDQTAGMKAQRDACALLARPPYKLAKFGKFAEQMKTAIEKMESTPLRSWEDLWRLALDEREDMFPRPGDFYLSFYLEAGKNDPNARKLPFVGDAEPFPLEPFPSLTEDSVLKAGVVESPRKDSSRIDVALTPGGAKIFGELTRQSVGKRLAIVVDGKVVSAPVIRAPIPGGKALIEGNFSRQEAEAIAEKLNFYRKAAGESLKGLDNEEDAGNPGSASGKASPADKVPDNPLGLDDPTLIRLFNTGRTLRAAARECVAYHVKYGKIPESAESLFEDYQQFRQGMIDDPFAAKGGVLRITQRMDGPDNHWLQVWSVGPDGDWDGGKVIDASDPSLDGDLGAEMRMGKWKFNWLADETMAMHLDGKRLSHYLAALGPRHPGAINPHQTLAWGPVVDGLCMAVKFVPDKETYSLGEKIGLEFHVRNISQHPITIAGFSWRQDAGPDCFVIENDQGEKLDVSHAWYSGRTPIQRNTLKPGKVAVFKSSALAFLVQGMPRPEHPVGHTVVTRPGRHTLQFKLIFPDGESSGPDGMPRPTDWQGALQTATEVIAVVAPTDNQANEGSDNAVGEKTAAAEAEALAEDARQPTRSTNINEGSRERFLAIERFARLPMAEQAKQLPQFYKDMDPRSINPIVEGILSSAPHHILDRYQKDDAYDGNTDRWAEQLADAASAMSIEEVADKLERPLFLNVAARARALQVLEKHADAASALIAEDLKSGDKDRVERATMAIVSLELRSFTGQLLAMWMADDELSESVWGALVMLPDPAIADPLLERVEKDPKFLARCAGLFLGPLAGKKAEPLLLKFLDSPDAEIRYHAAYALQECRDPGLALPTVRLAGEKEARFRFLAAHLVSKLPRESFATVREELLPLLSDKDEEVRFYALLSFGQHKDLAAGPVILEALRRDQLAENYKTWVMQAMSALSGKTWNYDTHHWGPGTPGNRKAIERFEKWLEEQRAGDVAWSNPVEIEIPPTKNAAKHIFDRYLKAPYPEGPAATDPYGSPAHVESGKARDARIAILAELRAMPGEAVSAAEQALFKHADPRQRLEIVGMLGDYFHTRECAELLHRVIRDVRKPEDKDGVLYEELVRSSAVQGLRMMARRTDRDGGKRVQRRPDFQEKVKWLVPYLVAAANDGAERVRVSALYALANSRDPAAVVEIRNRLKDPSEKVRLYAACFLTEYQNAAGLPEMRKALTRFKKTDADSERFLDYYTQFEMLLASLERITGKSFGEIPLNPSLVSIGGQGEAERYRQLLDAWHTYFTVESWGEAVDGVQVRVNEAGRVWGRSDWPHPVLRLRYDAKNEGPHTLHLPENGLSHQVKVDGQWYEWVDPRLAKKEGEPMVSRASRSLDFEPGRRHEGQVIEIAGNWRAIPKGKEYEYGARPHGGSGWVIDEDDYGEELVLTPGLHQVRIAVICPSAKADFHGVVRAESSFARQVVIGDMEPPDAPVQDAQFPELKTLDKTVYDKIRKTCAERWQLDRMQMNTFTVTPDQDEYLVKCDRIDDGEVYRCVIRVDGKGNWINDGRTKVSDRSAVAPQAHAESTYALEDILEALRERSNRYQAAPLKLEYTRTVNDVEDQAARTEESVLLTQWSNLREEAREVKARGQNGRALSRYLAGGIRAETVPAGARSKGSIRYLAHDTAHNIESTLWPHIHGPDTWFINFLREAGKAGNLKIETRSIALTKRSTDKDPRCVTLEAGGHRLTLVPEWDWAIVEYLGVVARGHKKHGDFWFPKQVTLHKTLKGPGDDWTNFQDEIVLQSVDPSAEIPKGAFRIPQPKPGDRVSVAYPKWKPEWEEPPVEPGKIRDAVRQEHSFTCSEEPNGRDARIWEISLAWRNAGRVSRALDPRPENELGFDKPPLPFLSPDGRRIIWALYDAAAKRMKLNERLPEQASVEKAGFKFEAGFIPEKTEIMAGEAIFVTFYVKNTGDKTLYLETGGDGRATRSYRFQFSAVDADGNPARDPQPNPGHFGGTQGPPPEIKPGETYSERLQLAKWLAFDRPGQYTVRCTRTLQFHKKQDFTPDYALVHPLVTEFRLKVVPRTEQGLAARIEALGKRLRAEEDENNARLTAQLLAETGDARIIPDLLWAAEHWSGDSWALRLLAAFKDDPRVIALYRDALRTSRGNSRRSNAARLMGESENKGFLPDLLRAFGDEDDKFVLTSVATALGQFGDRQAVLVLKKHRDHDYPHLRLAIAQALVKCGEALDVLRFQTMIRSTDPTWHSAAHFVSVNAGAAAPRILAECLDFDHPEADVSPNNADSNPAYRNGLLLMYIEQAGGPHFDYNRIQERPVTKQETEANRQTLRKVKEWLEKQQASIGGKTENTGGEDVETALLPKAENLPGKLVFHGRYRHRSRGRLIETPSELWLKQDENRQLHALTHLPWMGSYDLATGDANHRVESYLTIGKAKKGRPAYRIQLDLRKGKAMLTRKGIRQDLDNKEIPVPSGAHFDPNSRPDSYCAANIFLRGLGLAPGQAKEFAMFDWDNTGESLVDYSVRIHHAGKERVTVPAGTFEANHFVFEQLTTADTWFKKRSKHITEFWVLENGVIVRVMRHREPYEMELLDYTILLGS